MTAMEVEPTLSHHHVSDAEHFRLALAYLVRDISGIKRSLEKGQFDIDFYLSDNGTHPTGIIAPQKQIIKPFMIGFILAVWDTTSNAATLQINDRIMKFPPTLGIVSFDCAIQVQKDDVITFTVQQGKSCHIEIMGSSDWRKMDRS